MMDRILSRANNKNITLGEYINELTHIMQSVDFDCNINTPSVRLHFNMDDVIFIRDNREKLIRYLGEFNGGIE
jgi:hypothetical protein